MSFSVGAISANITGDPSDFNSAIDGVRKAGDRAASAIEKRFREVGKRMQSVGKKLTRGLTLPLLGAGGLALKTAADYETLQVQLDTLTGSAEKGAETFQKLKNYAAKTPFQLKDIAKANNTLLGFGESTNDAFDHLKMLGDIAGVTGGDLQAISVAFGQSAASGQLMTRDIRQLINQGVPALKLLSESMGVTKDQIFDLASQGEITFPILVKAFQDATSAGGMFENGTKKLAGTLAGVFSTLKDNASIALAAIGDSLEKTFDIKGLITGLTSQIQQGIKWFNNLSEQTKKTAFYIAGILGASGPVIAALGTLSLAISAISAPIAGVAAAVGAAAVLIVNHWDELSHYFSGGDGAKVWQTVKEMANSMFDSLKSLFSSFKGAAERIWDAFGANIVRSLKDTAKIIVAFAQTTIDTMATIIDVLSGKWLTDWDGFCNDVAKRFGRTFGRGGALRIIAMSFLDWFANDWLVQLSAKFSAKAVAAIGSIPVQIMKYFGIVPESTKTATDAINKFYDKTKSGAKDATDQAKNNYVSLFKLLNNFSPQKTQPKPHQKISSGSGVNASDIAAPYIAAKAPIDDAVSNINKIIGSITIPDIVYNLPDKMFPAGSLSDLQSQLASFKEQLQGAIDPERIQTLNMLIGQTQSKINAVTGASNVASLAGKRFAGSISNALAQAVFHGAKLLDTIKNLIEKFAEKIFIKGITMLLTGGTSGIIGGLFGGLFAKGGRPPVGMPSIVGENGPELFVPDSTGRIIPNNKMASMGRFSMTKSNASLSRSDVKGAFSEALSSHLQRLGPNELYILVQEGSRRY